MIISIVQVLMLLGAIQGFIFSGFAFFAKKYKSRSNFFLGMLILTFSYNIVQNFLVVSDWISSDAYFRFFYIPFTSVFLVLFYLYVRSFLYPKNKPQKVHYLLFLPFLIVFIESFLEKLGYANHIFTQEHTVYFNNFRLIQEIFNVVYSFVLIIFSYKLIFNYEKEQLSKKHRKLIIQLKWLKTITFILFCLCLYWILPLTYEFQYKLDLSTKYFYVLWIGLAVTIYALGYIGLYQFGIVQEQKSIQKFSAGRPVLAVSDINHSKSEQILKFEEFVKIEKNYLDSNLSLESVADSLGLNKTYLSRIINAELNKSFTDYVNELRVEEAKIYLENPDFQKYTLVSIGLEAGFNSKSTFNSTFKRLTGQTPSEYKSGLYEKCPVPRETRHSAEV